MYISLLCCPSHRSESPLISNAVMSNLFQMRDAQTRLIWRSATKGGFQTQCSYTQTAKCIHCIRSFRKTAKIAYRFRHVCLAAYLSVCLSVWLPICLSVCLSACLSVCVEQPGSHWPNFHEVRYEILIFFPKICREIQFSLTFWHRNYFFYFSTFCI